MTDTKILITSREQLIYTLVEAAEIEHNLMCCYLYAAWSLKTEPDDGIADDVRQEIRGWQQSIIHVAVDEMSHLAQTANLLNAIGGAAHFQRPNFPIASGYHPAGLQVRLVPFNPSTLQHFIHLERPEGNTEPDGEGFAQEISYDRGLNGLQLMPAAQDFPTVGHLYHAIKRGLIGLSENLGEAALFCGDRALQVDRSVTPLRGLIGVTNLATALQAIDTIVEQGEGSSEIRAGSHFQKFRDIRARYDVLREKTPGFAPAFPAATNPVMRKPPSPEGRVWIQNDQPRSILDLGNAVYNLMLQCLAQGFGRADHAGKAFFLGRATDLMFALGPLAKELARLKANDRDNCNAGLNFATLRSYPVIDDATARHVMAERIYVLSAQSKALGSRARVRAAQAVLERVAAKFGAPASSGTSFAPHNAPEVSVPELDGPETLKPGVEVVEGRDMTLLFDASRCIHARFCVTGAPKSFVANVKGDWLFPDETDVDRLVEIAHACPSGAVKYRRKDGKPDEVAPPVNLLSIREAGPYALRAEILLAGAAIGSRATLCRCGASKSKPYCDGSHQTIGFSASGEPPTASVEPLAVRDGTLRLEPQRDGPLLVEGNLEITSGTGRVVHRGTETRLCRCGQSGNKPFCDGSHREAGFVADGT